MTTERQKEILEYVLRNTSVSVFNANIKAFSTQRLYYNLKKDLMRAFPELDGNLEFAIRMAEIFKPYTCDEIACKENDSKLNRMLHTYKGIRRELPGRAMEIAKEHNALVETQNRLLGPQNRLIKLYRKIRREYPVAITLKAGEATQLKRNMKTVITPEQEKQRTENEFDLREMALYYGGWDELRKVIDELEAEDKVSAAERAYEN